MEDIEDLKVTIRDSISSSELKNLDGEKVLPTKFTKRQEMMREEVSVGEVVPGTQKIFLKTYGCSHNSSDSEYMAGLLVEYGYKVTDVWEEADAFLINSCTVKNPSQQTFMTLVNRAQDTGKPVIVSGCVPQGSPNDKAWKNLSVIGVQQINRVVEVVEESLKGNQVHFLSRTKKNKPSLDLPKIRRNPFIEVIPINVGCLGECTYCKTKHARGHLGSYPVEEISERVRSVLDEGVCEVRITSEDTGAYGIDLKTNIVHLLEAIVPLLPEGVMLRIGMTNPPYILEHLPSIAKFLNHPNVYSFLHVPVQSGSNRVLDKMKREYTVEEFKKVADTLISLVPGITIATDIICGFPGEDENDFKETLQLVNHYKFPILNISQFYPRPGTPAANMKKVPTQTVKARSRELTELFNSYSPYQHLLGTTQRAWITETATDGVHLVGHTKGYVQVLIDPQEASMGSDVTVQIFEIGKFFVRGKVVKKNSHQPYRKIINKAVVRKLRKRKENESKETEKECSVEGCTGPDNCSSKKTDKEIKKGEDKIQAEGTSPSSKSNLTLVFLFLFVIFLIAAIYFFQMGK